jgi:hypothetical protein
MQPGETLLICCKSYQKECKGKFDNITIKKIPQMLLGRCEYGKDDYSLNIINMPVEENNIVDDDNIYIYITEDLFEIFNKMKDCKLAELYISITKGVDKDKIKDNYINYLDIESDGTISFLKQKWWGEAGDAMTSKKRDKVRINRAIRGILKDDYIDSIITQPDVEKFMNTFNMIFKPLEVIELRGDDILRAYNYTSELNLKKFSASCANLQPGQLQNKKIFDVYTKNTNNMAVVVVIDYGRIVGRRTIQQGPWTREEKIVRFVSLFCVKKTDIIVFVCVLFVLHRGK